MLYRVPSHLSVSATFLCPSEFWGQGASYFLLCLLHRSLINAAPHRKRSSGLLSQILCPSHLLMQEWLGSPNRYLCGLTQQAY